LAPTNYFWTNPHALQRFAGLRGLSQGAVELLQYAPTMAEVRTMPILIVGRIVGIVGPPVDPGQYARHVCHGALKPHAAEA
jgi:hypothetical protein